MQKNRRDWIRRWMLASVLSLMTGVCLNGCGKTASDLKKGDIKEQNRLWKRDRI